MNCSTIFQAAGFHCQPLPQDNGAPVFFLSTPFQTFDGDGVHLFAEEAGPAIRFFDAGHTLFHLVGSGIKIKDGRSLAPIKKLVDSAGAALSEDGEIFAFSTPADPQAGMRKVLAAILAVGGWEEENAGIPDDAVALATEVEFYLHQWKPGLPIDHHQNRPGISGREYSFDFFLDGTLIDVVSSKPQSTAAKVRKLADVTGIPSQHDMPILIIIDDRMNATQATQEAAILRQFSPTRPLSWLIAEAEKNSLHQA